MYLLALLMGLFLKPVPVVVEKINTQIPAPIYCGLTPQTIEKIGDKIKIVVIVKCDNPSGYRIFLRHRENGMSARDIEFSDGPARSHKIDIYFSEVEALTADVVLHKNPKL
jgi:hypothetical protein